MNTPYEILIRFDDAGTYKGGHFLTRDSESYVVSTPSPITDAQWPEFCSTINTAALNRITAIESSTASAIKSAVLDCQTKFDELVKAAETAMGARDIDALQAILEQAKSITSEARAAEVEKKRADLQAQLDALK